MQQGLFPLVFVEPFGVSLPYNAPFAPWAPYAFISTGSEHGRREGKYSAGR